MAKLDEIVRYLDAELRTREVPDYDAALNGLQLGDVARDVKRVAAAVDFSLDSGNGAVREKADLLIVHHGMFWRGAQPFVGPNLERLRSVIAGNLAVYSSHIPLDLHPNLGNNVLLARELGLQHKSTFGRYKGIEIGVCGDCDTPTQAIADKQWPASECR